MDLVRSTKLTKSRAVLLIALFLLPFIVPQRSKMTTQKASLLLEKFGKLVVDNVPIQKPGPGEVLIKVKTAALNPIDWKIPKFGIYVTEFPHILGIDISGEVAELGEGVSNVAKGDRVLVQGDMKRPAYNGFQQYVKADAKTVATIPSNLSFDEAATIPLALSTSFVGLFNPVPHGLGIPSFLSPGFDKSVNVGKPIIILGGAGSVGQLSIQLAKLAGLSPIIVTASLKNTDLLKGLGATHVIDRHTEPAAFASEVRKITEKPIDYVFDTVNPGPEGQKAAIDLLNTGGVFAGAADIKAEVPADKKGVRVMSMKGKPENVEPLRQLYSQVSKLLEDGTIKPTKYEVVPGGLAGIPEGLEKLQTNQASGFKFVVHPEETAPVNNIILSWIYWILKPLNLLRN